MIFNSTPKYSIAELTAHLRHENVLDEFGSEKIGAFLENKRAVFENPWYIKLLVAIGAWTAAIFFLFFLFASSIINYNSSAQLLICGLILIASAVIINYIANSIFPAQSALALSVAGHILVLIGAGSIFDNHQYEILGAFLASVFLCPVLYPLYKNSLHRFLSCLLVTLTAIMYFMELGNNVEFYAFTLVEIVILGFLLMNRRHSKRLWRPMFYALIVSLFFLFAISFFGPDFSRHFHPIWLPAKIIMSLVSIWVFFHIAKKYSNRFPMKELSIFVILAIIVLGAVSTPGILTSLCVLVLGYRYRDSFLTALGLMFFPIYISMFYYNLDMRLDVKSLIMGGTGLALLGLREILRRRDWIKGEKA